MKTTGWVVAWTILCGCGPGTTPTSDAGPNLLDPSFGTGGKVQTSFDCTDDARAQAVVARADGGFVVGGKACRSWVLVGYRDDGSIDPSYGTAGTTSLFADAGDYYEIQSLVARPDGRLIARGKGNTFDSVRQFSPTGAVDLAFAAAADQALNGASLTFVEASALLVNGKLLVASWSASGAKVVRLLVDGSADSWFGTGGLVNVNLSGSVFLLKLLVRPNGRILLIGRDQDPLFPNTPFVAQLWPTGALDTSFGNGGVVKVRPPIGGNVWLQDAVLQSDGKLLLAGAVRSSSSARDRATLWRITPEGEVDAPFGASGAAEAPPAVGDCAFSAVSVLGDGRIVAVGSYQRSSGVDSWLVARFTPSGALDSTLGATGFSVFEIGGASLQGGATGLLATPAGYVVVGRAFPGGGWLPTFGVARVLP